MVELPKEESSEEQANTKDDEKAVQDASSNDMEAKAAAERRKRISREEVFDEWGHIPGYSDMQGFSNLAFVFTVEEEDADEDEEDDEKDADDPAEDDEVTRTINTQQQTTRDSTSTE